MAAQLNRVARGVPGAIRASLVEVGSRGERVVKEGYLSGNRLAVRSGRLRGSVTMAVSEGPPTMQLSAGAARGVQVKYAQVLEDGGVIVPKRGRFLAIPVRGGPACTPSGVTKAGWESPRTAPVKLRFVRTTRGGILVLDKKNSSTIVYRLVRSVKIAGRHYMRDAGALVTEAFPVVLSERIARLFQGVA
jgi:hypothetical protein